MTRGTIGVDVGGTKIAAGLLDESGAVLARCQVPTPAEDGPATVAAIAMVVERLVAGSPGVTVAAVGAAIAGLVDASRTTVLHASNVGGWRNEPLAARLNEATGLPVVLDNDANAAAWGEASQGDAPTAGNLVVVTVGTGIGGAIIVEGALHRGEFGVAGEIGHLTIEHDGRTCTCGGRGCWEQYASGSALVAAARAGAASHPGTASLLLSMAGSAEAIEGRHVMNAAREGDPIALAAFTDCGTWLGRGLATLAAVLDPGAFVIGGGVAEAGELLLEPARNAFHGSLLAREHRPAPVIVAGSLGNDAGLVGAALLARTAATAARRLLSDSQS